MTRRLRIALASAGRFHLLDVARELRALGHEVKFYSYVPRSRARQFGLPDECHVSLLPFVFPALVMERLFPRRAPRLREKAIYFALNRGVILRLQPCDVFIFMSGIYLEAARYAKHRFGAKTILERGSRHILSQDKILAECNSSERPSALTISRELEGYEIADRISIPSSHVDESFREYQISKTEVIPYGVDLRMFPFRPQRRRTETFTFITIGQWSLQKGSDILAAAVRRIPGARLVHVGSIADVEFPQEDAQFVHFGSVQQHELRRFYTDSDTFVLASRQDGLSVVLVQALASGLPVICTDRTGGSDLAHTPALAGRITVVPHNDVDALVSAMIRLRDQQSVGHGLPQLAKADLEWLSWPNYARRLSATLLGDFGKLGVWDDTVEAGQAELYKKIDTA
jgi:glycosyltransferase involved in cell wall biosynthesis